MGHFLSSHLHTLSAGSAGHPDPGPVGCSAGALVLSPGERICCVLVVKCADPLRWNELHN